MYGCENVWKQEAMVKSKLIPDQGDYQAAYVEYFKRADRMGQRMAEIEAALRALVGKEWSGAIGESDYWSCAYCGRLTPFHSEHVYHDPDCPVVEGRKALGDGKA